MPYRVRGPVRTILGRLAVAVGLIVVAACVVYAGRDGYRDATGRPVNWLTSFYYAVVTLTTIGYGDVVPVTGTARLVNTLVITPLRLGFLLVLVGTTFRALTERTRREWSEQSWRRKVRDHTVVIGYGTTGRAAVSTLRARGGRPRRIIVIDPDPAAVGDANRHGLVGIVGDGTGTDVLERAELGKARHVLIATSRDDTAVLAALTARRMNPSAVITASVARAENVPLLRGGGADNVITSSETAGHLLGVAALNPAVGTVLEDLLSVGFGLEVAERPPDAGEVGRGTEHIREPLLAVVRDGRPLRYCDPQIGGIRADDRLIVAREAPGADARRQQG
ncbi:potassium channel family protein [Streptomyces sp. PLK6-54]|uniref:Potassium channel family protein n=2 Tax=Actinacidiphila acidipaludis TaxID=2873382 RepID=A0ABS7QCK5_9ACTN|nr:potassium channel family protein [Streptomyces acidipaludis]